MLWDAGPDCGPEGRSVRGLIYLTSEVEAIEEEAVRRIQRAGAYVHTRLHDWMQG